MASSFQGLFEEDNLAAYHRAVQEAGEVPGLQVWPVVNPSRPNQLARLEKVLGENPARGLRLLPNYHGYRLDAPFVGELMEWARSHGLVVQVFQAIADVRWHWLLVVQPVSDEELVCFARKFPEAEIILGGLARPRAVADVLRANPRCYLDLSGVRGPLFAVEHLVADLPATQILFGSLWPLQAAESILEQIKEARLGEETRALLLGENALRAGLVSPSFL